MRSISSMFRTADGRSHGRPLLPELRGLAEGSATPVRFRGWIENPSDELDGILRGSSAFVLPSEAENFPVALLEAMAAGLAIVTT